MNEGGIDHRQFVQRVTLRAQQKGYGCPFYTINTNPFQIANQQTQREGRVRAAVVLWKLNNARSAIRLSLIVRKVLQCLRLACQDHCLGLRHATTCNKIPYSCCSQRIRTIAALKVNILSQKVWRGDSAAKEYINTFVSPQSNAAKAGSQSSTRDSPSTEHLSHPAPTRSTINFSVAFIALLAVSFYP